MTVTNVTEPADQVLDLAIIKDHLRIDGTQDDELLRAYLSAATAALELSTGQYLAERTVDIVLDKWPAGDTIKLEAWPVQSIASVSYTDEDGTTEVLSSSVYVSSLDGIPARLVLKNDQAWPTVTLQEADGVTIRAVVGYSGAIPDLAIQVLLLTIGLWYENRENLHPTYLKELPLGIESLSWGLRVRL